MHRNPRFMVWKAVRAVAIAASLALAQGCLAVPGGNEAADLVLQTYAELGLDKCSLNLGEMVVVEQEGPGQPKGAISRRYFERILHWEKAGLVAVTAEDVLSSSKPFSWDDWFARTQRGELRRIQVEATEQGRALAEVGEGTSNPTSLAAECHRTRVEEIAADQEVEVRGERYRLIQARLYRNPTPLGKAIWDAEPREPGGWYEDIKMRLLLKWDVFKKQWERADYLSFDLGPLDGEWESRRAVLP